MIIIIIPESKNAQELLTFIMPLDIVHVYKFPQAKIQEKNICTVRLTNYSSLFTRELLKGYIQNAEMWSNYVLP